MTRMVSVSIYLFGEIVFNVFLLEGVLALKKGGVDFLINGGAVKVGSPGLLNVGNTNNRRLFGVFTLGLVVSGDKRACAVASLVLLLSTSSISLDNFCLFS
jgi:hypothetical protein